MAWMIGGITALPLVLDGREEPKGLALFASLKAAPLWRMYGGEVIFDSEDERDAMLETIWVNQFWNARFAAPLPDEQGSATSSAPMEGGIMHMKLPKQHQNSVPSAFQRLLEGTSDPLTHGAIKVWIDRKIGGGSFAKTQATIREGVLEIEKHKIRIPLTRTEVYAQSSLSSCGSNGDRYYGPLCLKASDGSFSPMVKGLDAGGINQWLQSLLFHSGHFATAMLPKIESKVASLRETGQSGPIARYSLGKCAELHAVGQGAIFQPAMERPPAPVSASVSKSATKPSAPPRDTDAAPSAPPTDSCSKCGTAAIPGCAFCAGCGSRLGPPACLQCSFQFPGAAMAFCPSCGAKQP